MPLADHWNKFHKFKAEMKALAEVLREVRSNLSRSWTTVVIFTDSLSALDASYKPYLKNLTKLEISGADLSHRLTINAQ